MENFIKEHFSFILTILITYSFSILFIIFQFLALDVGKEEQFFDIMLNSLVPTTITYAFGCVLVNIVELFKDKTDDYIFNVFAIYLIVIYAIVFIFYWFTGFTWGWVFGELIATALIIFFNILCYREKYRNRNHTLM